jgi:hypothetical protein
MFPCELLYSMIFPVLQSKVFVLDFANIHLSSNCKIKSQYPDKRKQSGAYRIVTKILFFRNYLSCPISKNCNLATGFHLWLLRIT